MGRRLILCLREQFNSLAERLRLRTNRKPSYAEEEGAEDEESQEEVEEEAGDKDDETLEVLKMEQVFFSSKSLVLLRCLSVGLAIDLCLIPGQL